MARIPAARRVRRETRRPAVMSGGGFGLGQTAGADHGNRVVLAWTAVPGPVAPLARAGDRRLACEVVVVGVQEAGLRHGVHHPSATTAA